MTRNGTYLPKTSRLYKKKVRDAYIAASGGVHFGEAPVKITMLFRYPIPKSYSKKKIAAIRDRGFVYAQKPDGDNLAKSIMDALNGVAYADDKQVVCHICMKAYARRLEDVGMLMEIVDLNELQAKEMLSWI